jgi:acyl carrier protein
MTDTLEKVRTIISNECSVPEDRIQAASSLDSLSIDSLGAIEVLFRIEDEFKIRIPQERSAGVRITTVQDIIDIVERLIAEQRTA